jgi:hypothetical protein
LSDNHFSLIGSDVEPPLGAFHTKHIFDYEEPEDTAHDGKKSQFDETNRTISQVPSK